MLASVREKVVLTERIHLDVSQMSSERLEKVGNNCHKT